MTQIAGAASAFDGKSSSLRTEFCFVNAQLQVTASTAGCAALFGVSAEELRSGNIGATGWIENITELVEQIADQWYEWWMVYFLKYFEVLMPFSHLM